MNLENIYIAHISFGNNPQTKVVMADSQNDALQSIEYLFPEQPIFCIVSVKEVLDLRQNLEERQSDRENIWYYFESNIEQDIFSSEVKDLNGKRQALSKFHDNPMAIWLSYDQMIVFLDGLLAAIAKLTAKDLIITSNLR